MKNEKLPKSKRVVDTYLMKHQLHGGFKVVEVFHFPGDTGSRKRTIAKNLTMTDAENLIYRLER